VRHVFDDRKLTQKCIAFLWFFADKVSNEECWIFYSWSNLQIIELREKCFSSMFVRYFITESDIDRLLREKIDTFFQMKCTERKYIFPKMHIFPVSGDCTYSALQIHRSNFYLLHGQKLYSTDTNNQLQGFYTFFWNKLGILYLTNILSIPVLLKLIDVMMFFYIKIFIFILWLLQSFISIFLWISMSNLE